MAEFRVEWTDAARDDLYAIARYIARDSAISALAVVERIERRAAALFALPRRGRVVPELRRLGTSGVRELIEPPWRILYSVEKPRVLVLAVVDGRRDLGKWLAEEPARFQ